MEFEYHMYGRDINKLIIYTTDRGPDNSWRQFTDDHGDSWVHAAIDVELDNDRVR